MISPITGKEMERKVRQDQLVFRKETFTYTHHYYHCTDSEEEFTDEQLDTLNVNQIYNQYREKHQLPFPDEINSTREQYGLSATKMAEVLGFGINNYRLYEAGEVPSISNARLIQAAKDPAEFKKFLLRSDVYEGRALQELLKRLDGLIANQTNFYTIGLPIYLMGGLNNGQPSIYTGFATPNLMKMVELIVYYSRGVPKLYKTKLNKLLFYTDFVHYKKTGFGITGACYTAIQMGPVPDNFGSIFEYAASNAYVDITYEAFSEGVGELFTSCDAHNFDINLFTQSELETMGEILLMFKSKKTKVMIDLSHEEQGWLDNYKEKRKISYEYAFVLKNA